MKDDNYNVLLELMKKADTNKKIEIINNLKNNLSIIAKYDKYFNSLFMIIFKFNWISSIDLCNKIIEFYIDLLSANNSYTHIIIDNIIDNLFYIISPEDNDKEDILNIKNTIIQIILDTINIINKLIPTSSYTIQCSIIKQFPYKTRSLSNQKNAFNSTLKICDIIPEIRENLWSLMLEKMIDIDVEMKIDEEDVFNETIDDDMSNKLDKIMIIIMEYFLKECSKNENNLTNVFTFLLTFFESKILLTHKCRATQFILFRICSINHTFADKFVGSLINYIYTFNAPLIIRQSCSSYLASYVARANYLTIDIIKSVCYYLFNYCTNYMTQVKINNNIYNYESDDTKMFYSCFQTSLYIICFRIQNILQDKDGLNYLQSFPWNDYFISVLKPLRICVKEIVDEFINITENYSLYDISLIQNLSPQLSNNSNPNTPNTPSIIQNSDIFYPFDPYPLKESEIYFNKYYKNWDNEDEDDEDDDEINEREKEKPINKNIINSLENIITSFESLDTGVLF